uniref:Uncharacterized protein n=1 Tax=Otus sunia TaxID=257818 RepID=A0A8C8BHN1_9STRI
IGSAFGLASLTLRCRLFHKTPWRTFMALSLSSSLLNVTNANGGVGAAVGGGCPSPRRAAAAAARRGRSGSRGKRGVSHRALRQRRRGLRE